jgi:hypothetical protein
MGHIDKLLEGLPDQDQNNLRQANAIKWYQLDGDRLAATEQRLIGQAP